MPWSAGACGYDARVRRLLIIVTLVLLVAVAIGVGVAVARWPHGQAWARHT
jgi:hypothetical protein